MGLHPSLNYLRWMRATGKEKWHYNPFDTARR